MRESKAGAPPELGGRERDPVADRGRQILSAALLRQVDRRVRELERELLELRWLRDLAAALLRPGLAVSRDARTIARAAGREGAR